MKQLDAFIRCSVMEKEFTCGRLKCRYLRRVSQLQVDHRIQNHIGMELKDNEHWYMRVYLDGTIHTNRLDYLARWRITNAVEIYLHSIATAINEDRHGISLYRRKPLISNKEDAVDFFEHIQAKYELTSV